MSTVAATRLGTLRERLGALRRRRRNLRWGMAGAALALAVLLALAADFAVDWSIEWGRPYRAAAALVVVAGVAWVWRRWCAGWLGQEETELDMAILIERRQRIDSDLVAALQFESAAATSWGSPQLERAVVDYVAEFGNEINVLEHFSWSPLMQRAAWLAAVAAPLTLAGLLFPGHAAAFFNRLFLGSAHYPTRTQIDSMALNGQAVYPVPDDAEPLRSPEGSPLQFEVRCRGELPQQGEARLRAAASGLKTRIELVAAADRPGVYVGKLPRLVDPVDYQLYLGDAWTDPQRVDCIPLPVINVTLVPTPPAYAAAAAPAPDSSGGERQVAVLEGSQVTVQVACANKRLQAATLTIGELRYPLRAEGHDGRAWVLDPAGPPLDHVTEPLRYAVQVLDEDGLALAHPVEGQIRIKGDRPPRVTADLVTRRVLPSARPTLTYEATDDFGLASLRVARQVVRGTSAMQEDWLEIPLAADDGGGRPPRQVRGRLPIDLAPLEVKRGDQVKLTLEAVDFRGEAAGRTATSEPLVLEVTDERGVLAGMIESDERAARQLDAVIERQIGIGASK